MTKLTQGNKALRDKDYQQAVAFYIEALMANPELSKAIVPNVTMAQQKFTLSREENKGKYRVAVCGWGLSDNAERVCTLAKLYETFAEVEIIGALFPKSGSQVSESIRDISMPVHSFVVDDESLFLEQALKLVINHPFDMVHLSQPKMPNIFFGLLYKLIWNAKVLVDIDDEELVTESAINVDEYIRNNGSLPELKALDELDWTRLALSLIDEFDGVTVSNVAFQQYYGGAVIHHVQKKKPSSELIASLQKTFDNIKQPISQKNVSSLMPFYSFKELFCLIDNEKVTELILNHKETQNKSENLDNKFIYAHKFTSRLIKTQGSIMIIGSAPTIEDNLQKIKKHVGECWALNGAWFWLEKNNIKVHKAFITDPRFIKDNYESIKNTICNIIVTIDSIHESCFPKVGKKIYIFKTLGRDGFSKKYEEVYHGTSVFFTALQVAYNVGYKKITSCGVMFPPPFNYIRINGDSNLPEYVHKYQLKNAHLSLEILRESKVNFYPLESESNLNFV
jgi:hypothetical protein